MRTGALVLLLVALSSVAYAQSIVQASCYMIDTGISPRTVSGVVTFTYNNVTALTTVSVSVTGLPPSKNLGFHVHQNGNIGTLDGSGAGGHFNPFNQSHAYPTTDSRHVGDLGNLTTDASGTASGTIVVNLLQFSGNASIIGRGLIIHAAADDGQTQPTGNSGARYGQCVIGIAASSYGAVADATGNNFAAAELSTFSPNTYGYSRRLKGRVVFQQTAPGTVTVYARLCGFLSGTTHSLAITQYGDLQVANGVNSFGNNIVTLSSSLIANSAGVIDNVFSLSLSLSGASSIIGQGLVVYETTDTTVVANRSLVGVIGTTATSAGLPLCGIEIGACYLKNTSIQASPTVGGTVIISHVPNDPNGVTITATVTGLLPNTTHGWHVHELGYIGTADGSGVLSHYNPFSNGHGLPNNTRHIGDLGNLQADANGVATVSGYYPSDLVFGFSGFSSVVGRAIIIHQNADNGTGPVGFAGSRLAQCVIGIANDASYASQLLVNTAVADNTTMPVGSYYGTCELFPIGSSISGRVIFNEITPGVMRVQAQICGAAANSPHGFHVHQYGDLTGSALNTLVGGHYNPVNVSHGYYEAATHHVGDMGNVTADANGNIYLDRTFNGIQAYRMLSILGRSVVLHQNADDGVSQPSGNSGTPIATCVIGLTYPTADFTGVVCQSTPTPTPTSTVSVTTTSSPVTPATQTPTPTLSNASYISYSIAMIVMIAFMLL